MKCLFNIVATKFDEYLINLLNSLWEIDKSFERDSQSVSFILINLDFFF